MQRQPGLNKTNDSQYSIGAFWYFLQNKDKPIRQYMMQADQEGFEKVHLLDKNKIVDYFQGKIEAVDDINKTLIPDTLVMPGRLKEVTSQSDISKGASGRRDDKAKQKAEDEKGDSSGVIQKSGSSQDRSLDVMKFILKNESKIMKSHKQNYDSSSGQKSTLAHDPLEMLAKPQFQVDPKIISKNGILQAPGKSFAKIYSL